MTEADVEAAVSTGFLAARRDTRVREPLYWYSHPRLGTLVTVLRKVRDALVRVIKATKYKEMALKEVHKRATDKRFPSLVTPLGFHYHMFDVVGAGLLVRVTRPDGSYLLRFPR